MKFSKLPLVAAAASLTLVAACEPGGPNEYQKTQQGALIGALGGAAVGALANNGGSNRDRNQAALVGAALGAGVGAGIGNSLDKQAEELRRQLRSDVGVSNNGTDLRVVLSQDLLFATDSTAVSGVSQNELLIVARSLNNHPNTTVNVVGHTDNTGAAAYNFDLSQRRAQAVASVLRSGGVSSSRIRAIGAGEDQPVASNLNASGRAANRRVEIIITPNG
ncbi:outer membrane protein OmpA-like peptidoglycan-associated protein [Yoonia maritima]|uniref:Outer membrane protein OmpA-like peptidoglycan-associated protein n=1 Tax=Yoonia maritima TaxID=1435347 RepID=A0A2T0W2Y9_9RHOB|nr:OmpA family protein [Yoonia maritima]PRY79506.1 outer membrane protein OmpA-like peptidoglycan-associated protein [Yoonia maritima]